MSARIEVLKQDIKQQGQADNEEQPHVIVGTMDNGVANIKKYEETVDHIFVDEAASIPLPKGMVLLHARKPITLFGDHKQLPPIDNINIANIQATDVDMCIWRFSMLYMADIFRRSKDYVITNSTSEVLPDFKEIPTVILSKTFRYDNALTKILNSHVYKAGLTSANTGTTKLCYHTVSSSNNTGLKRVNTAEIEAICDIIQKHNLTGDIGIISPYKNQVFQIEKAIKNMKGPLRNKITSVSTVHRAQGREYDTVILSVSDRVDNAWFANAAQPRGQLCINVAVSRAKRTLIIVCDQSWTWGVANKQLISDIISIAQKI